MEATQVSHQSQALYDCYASSTLLSQDETSKFIEEQFEETVEDINRLVFSITGKT